MRKLLIMIVVLNFVLPVWAEDTPKSATSTNSVKLSHNELLEIRNLRLEQEVLLKQLENFQLQAQQIQKEIQDRGAKIENLAQSYVVKSTGFKPASIKIDYDKNTIEYTKEETGK